MHLLPRRRWFQFGLRTMFVVVTAFGIWLGWELILVRERLSMQQWIESNGGTCWTLDDFPRLRNELPDESTAPWRRWLGDKSVFHVIMPGEATIDDCSRVQQVLTEIPHDYPLARRRFWVIGAPIDDRKWLSELTQ